MAIAHGIEVDRVLERVGAVGDAAELLTQQRLRVADQLLHLRLDQVDPVLVDDCLQARLTRPARGDLSEDVALGRLGDAHVAEDEAQDLVVQLTFANEVDRRNVERLAVGRRGLCMEAPWHGPAGVRPVRGVLDEGQEIAVAEDRHDRPHVLAVSAPDEGVVHDEDVALVDPLLADPRDQALHRVRERSDVGRQVLLPLGDHASVAVADSRAEVTSLADDKRVADALEHQTHLVDDAHEGVAEHLEGHRIDPPDARRRGHRPPLRPHGTSSKTAASKTAVWRSTSASVVAGDINAMLWNGVSRIPRFRA